MSTALVGSRIFGLSVAALLTGFAAPVLPQGQTTSAVSISELRPTSAPSGSASLELVVRGTGFTRKSQVRINGHPRSTTFASANELRTQLKASDLASPSSMAVTVFTPARGPTSSLTLTIVGGNPPTLAHDNKAPTLVVPSNISLTGTGTGNPVVTFIATATDESGTATVTCEPPSGSVFAYGTTPVTCTARDPSGNTTSGTFAVTVALPSTTTIDTEPPRLENFPSITVSATSVTGVGVTFRAPFATDNSGSATVTCVPAADVIHNFPVGTTPVTCTARDPSGNTANLTFNVIVTPLPPPL